MVKKYQCKKCSQELFTKEPLKYLNQHVKDKHSLGPYKILNDLLSNFMITEYESIYRNDA